MTLPVARFGDVDSGHQSFPPLDQTQRLVLMCFQMVSVFSGLVMLIVDIVRQKGTVMFHHCQVVLRLFL